MREGSIYRTTGDDGAPLALMGLECTACGRIHPDTAHIAEALAEGAQLSPWIRSQLEVAVATSTRSLARRRFTISTQAPPLKTFAVEWPGTPRRAPN
jgi:hypothetical protein